MTPDARLRLLFKYNTWATLKLLAVLEEQESFALKERTHKMFYHLLGAQELWYRRITGGDLSDIEVWPKYELDECRSIIETLHNKWLRLIDRSEDDLDRTISYKNSKGVAFDTALSDILHHVIIHGQHHRAQIAIFLRESEIAPPATDFIFYTRDNNT